MTTPPGFEPGIFWSVVRHLIHLATRPELLKHFPLRYVFDVHNLYLFKASKFTHCCRLREHCCRKFLEKKLYQQCWNESCLGVKLRTKSSMQCKQSSVLWWRCLSRERKRNMDTAGSEFNRWEDGTTFGMPFSLFTIGIFTIDIFLGLVILGIPLYFSDKTRGLRRKIEEINKAILWNLRKRPNLWTDFANIDEDMKSTSFNYLPILSKKVCFLKFSHGKIVKLPISTLDRTKKVRTTRVSFSENTPSWNSGEA